jgi:hypothetical protein
MHYTIIVKLGEPKEAREWLHQHKLDTNPKTPEVGDLVVAYSCEQDAIIIGRLALRKSSCHSVGNPYCKAVGCPGNFRIGDLPICCLYSALFEHRDAWLLYTITEEQALAYLL